MGSKSAHNAKRGNLDSELVMGVFWVEHKSKIIRMLSPILLQNQVPGPETYYIAALLFPEAA